MRICMLTEYFNPGGAGGVPSMMPQLAQRLMTRYRDLQIEVITSRNIYRGEGQLLRPAYEQWEGVDVFSLNTPRSNQANIGKRLLAGSLFSAAAFGKMMSRPAYDLILSATSPPMIPAAVQAVSALKGTPYVYLIHDLFPDVGVALGTLPAQHPVTKTAHQAQRGWLHGAARVVVIGRCMRDYIHREYQLPIENISIIPNWSDAQFITPRGKDTKFRKAHGLNGFVMLYAGNFGHYQNFDTILDAAKQLTAAGRHDIHIVFVGDGAKREHIAQRIAVEGITNAHQFPLVDTEDYPDLLASADAALVTLEPGAEAVGVPSKFYNILAAGRPVVAILAPSSEVARVIDESWCGVRVNQGDQHELAQTIVNLADAPDTCTLMGQNARKAMESSFTLDHAAERFYRAFNHVVAERQPATVGQRLPERSATDATTR